MSAQNHSGVKVNTPTAVFFAAALDIVMVALFAVIGRQSHAIGLSIGAVFQTMWPFTLGLTVAWLVFRVWRKPLSPLSGVFIAFTALVFGQVIRILSRTGTFSVPFIMVSAIALLLLLVGWRLIGAAITKITARSRH